MLHKLNDLDDFSIHATDGNIGSIKDFYFDDKQWVIRYFIVETGSWLDSRKVLLSPISIKHLDLEEKVLTLSIAMDQVKHSPPIDTQQPVSQQYEIDYLSYYGYPFYWGNAGLWGAYASPTMIAAGDANPLYKRKDDPQIAETFAAIDAVRRTHGDRHLRSCNEIVNYHIQAVDGEIGHLQGMLVDEDTWAVRYFIVNTSNWWLGHQVLIAPQWVEDISWGDSKIVVDLTQQQIKDAPIFDPDVPLSRQKELGIYIHYGRTGYWESPVKLNYTE
jgi:hypothetical protein